MYLLEVVIEVTPEQRVTTELQAMTKQLYGVFSTSPVTVPLVTVLLTLTAVLVPTLAA